MPQEINDAAQRVEAHTIRADTADPVRQCCVTRERLPQSRMLRFVLSPENIAVPDVAGKLPGRGAWMSADKETVERGLASEALSRAFKAKTQTSEVTLDLIEQQLATRCIGLLGMAKKSGQATLGYDQVRTSLRKTSPGWILTAEDSAEDSRSKVHFLARALYKDLNIAGGLTSAELGMAFGRQHVIHAVLSRGRLAESFGIAYRRLTEFRPAPETSWFVGGALNRETNSERSERQKGKRPGQV